MIQEVNRSTWRRHGYSTTTTAEKQETGDYATNNCINDQFSMTRHGIAWIFTIDTWSPHLLPRNARFSVSEINQRALQLPEHPRVTSEDSHSTEKECTPHLLRPRICLGRVNLVHRHTSEWSVGVDQFQFSLMKRRITSAPRSLGGVGSKSVWADEHLSTPACFVDLVRGDVRGGAVRYVAFGFSLNEQ